MLNSYSGRISNWIFLKPDLLIFPRDDKTTYVLDESIILAYTAHAKRYVFSGNAASYSTMRLG
jgi:hypothetical protein